MRGAIMAQRACYPPGVIALHLTAVFTAASLVLALARAPAPQVPPRSPAPVERLGDNLLRVGNIRVDTKAREITLPGKVNDVTALEFIATAKGGVKAYESALELDTDAITFNLALLLIGLDRKNSVVPTMHFDPNPPKGDPVEILIEWDADGKRARARGEELVYNATTNQTLPPDSWVYTGSQFMEHNNAYLAELEGTLIGFVHTPAPVIENSAPIAGSYGDNQLNKKLNLKPGTPITLTIRALPKRP
jgi:hypothetical protein